MLLLVVASSVVDSDWQVASDEVKHVASCCCGQHCRFGLASCKRQGETCCFLLLQAASLVWIGELQVTRDNMLLLVVANSVVDLDWQVASDKGQYVASCCREQRRRFRLASCKQRGQYIASCCCEQRRRFGWRVASDEGQYVASCCRGQRCRFEWRTSGYHCILYTPAKCLHRHLFPARTFKAIKYCGNFINIDFYHLPYFISLLP